MESIKPIPQLHNKWGIRSFLSELCGSFRKIRAVFSSKAQSESNSDAQKVSLAESALDRHGNAILRLAYSYLHNQSDAEDILQDTLLKYMQAAPTFEGEEHEKAWLLRVAANLSKNKIQYNIGRNTGGRGSGGSLLCVECGENTSAKIQGSHSFVLL